jgi:hypothetical protein
MVIWLFKLDLRKDKELTDTFNSTVISPIETVDTFHSSSSRFKLGTTLGMVSSASSSRRIIHEVRVSKSV